MSKYQTNDWKWFLRDLETQLDQQMQPDGNEVEKYAAEHGGPRSPVAEKKKGEPPPLPQKLSTVLPKSYGTFSESRSTSSGCINGDEEEMPAVSMKARAARQ